MSLFLLHFPRRAGKNISNTSNRFKILLFEFTFSRANESPFEFILKSKSETSKSLLSSFQFLYSFQFSSNYISYSPMEVKFFEHASCFLQLKLLRCFLCFTIRWLGWHTFFKITTSFYVVFTHTHNLTALFCYFFTIVIQNICCNLLHGV